MARGVSAQTIEMMKAYAAGDDIKDIAARYGCTTSNVRHLARRRGVVRGSVVDDLPSQKERDEILVLFAAGIHPKDIAEYYGRTLPPIYMLAKKHGIERGPCASKSIAQVLRQKAVAVSSPTVSEVRRLKAKGLSITAIGALLRCPYRDVASALTA